MIERASSPVHIHFDRPCSRYQKSPSRLLLAWRHDVPTEKTIGTAPCHAAFVSTNQRWVGVHPPGVVECIEGPSSRCVCFMNFFSAPG